LPNASNLHSLKINLVSAPFLAYNDGMSPERKIAECLKKSRQTLAIAESCSGGLIAHRITNIPGSSAYFKAGFVTYSNAAKQGILKIPTTVLRRHGAVSRPTAARMAQNARKTAQADLGIGVTGIAGPSGGTTQKPVGLVYIAVSKRSRTVCRKFLFKGSRQSIKRQTATAALVMLLKLLKG